MEFLPRCSLLLSCALQGKRRVREDFISQISLYLPLEKGDKIFIFHLKKFLGEIFQMFVYPFKHPINIFQHIKIRKTQNG